MILHYITRTSRKAKDWPFAKTLSALTPEFKIFADEVNTNYKSKIELLFVVYPKMFIFAIKMAFSSLTAKQYPDIVLLESDVEILSYCIVRKILLKPYVQICYSCFIFTGSSSSTLGWLKRKYYKLILSSVQKVIVHSKREVENYSILFPNDAHKFEYVAYGIGAPADKIDYEKQERVDNMILTAGRSCRDYSCLIKAAQKTPYKYQILCDSYHAIADDRPAPNVTVIRACFGQEYTKKIFEAQIIVIPLARHDISAGQMVLLHAMAYRKPIIITETDSIKDYLHVDNCVYFVPSGDDKALAAAITKLMKDKKLRVELASNAGVNYDGFFTPEVMAKNYHQVLMEFYHSISE